MNENFKANLRQNRFTVSLREGIPVPGSGGGGDPQTPWLSNIDAAQFHLDNATRIAGVPTASGTPYLFFGTGMAQGNVTLAAADTGSLYLRAPAITIASSNVEITSATPSRVYVWGDIDITGQYLVNSQPISVGGGSQTPWESDIDAAYHAVNNVTTIRGISGGALNLMGDSGVFAYGGVTALGDSSITGNLTSVGNIGVRSGSYVGDLAGGANIFFTPAWIYLNSYTAANQDFLVYGAFSVLRNYAPAFQIGASGDVDVTGHTLNNLGGLTLANDLYIGGNRAIFQFGPFSVVGDGGYAAYALTVRTAQYQRVGINLSEAGYTLDVGGDINLTGSLRFNGQAVTVDANGFLKLE